MPVPAAVSARSVASAAPAVSVNRPLWAWLLVMALGFLLAYWMWPRHREVESGWFDVLELLVELPVNALLGLLRLLGRFFRDIDLPGS